MGKVYNKERDAVAVAVALMLMIIIAGNATNVITHIAHL